MDLFTAIETRRAVKHYDPSAPVAPEAFEKIMQATLRSPTSYNIQHWRFVRVQDTALREQIQDAAWGQTQITEAGELIVLCADTQAWRNQPQRYYRNTDADTRRVLLEMLHNFYVNQPQRQHDEALRSCGIAAQTFMLAASGLGYATCPMIGFDNDKVAQLINLPKDHIIAMLITLGKAAKPAHPRAGQLSLSDVLVVDRF